MSTMGGVCRLATEDEQVEKLMQLSQQEPECEEIVMESLPRACPSRETSSPTGAGGCLQAEQQNMEIGGSSSSGPSRRLSPFLGEGAECSICFAPLPSQQVCVLIERVYGTRRSCRHYFHLECAKLMVRSTPAPHTCPLCRTVFERLEPLPDVRLDSAAWFSAVDADGGGVLEKAEVVDALSATLPVEPELLANALEGELWRQWTLEGGGRLTRHAFQDPSSGLLRFVLYSLPSLRREATAGLQGASVPDLVSSREGWFRYWDESGRASLEFMQCLRALARSLRLEGSREDAGALRRVLSALWREFGLTVAGNEDGDVELLRPVTMKLFCEKSDGFCDALVDELQKEFGATRFGYMRRRAQLLHQPVAALKKELKRLDCPVNAIEKEEMVDAILQAEAQRGHVHFGGCCGHVQGDYAPGECSPDAEVFVGPGSPPQLELEALRALSVKELQAELQARGETYDHCLERRDLEELLAHSESQRVAAAGETVGDNCAKGLKRTFARLSSEEEREEQELQEALRLSMLETAEPVRVGSDDEEDVELQEALRLSALEAGVEESRARSDTCA